MSKDRDVSVGSKAALTAPSAYVRLPLVATELRTSLIVRFVPEASRESLSGIK